MGLGTKIQPCRGGERDRACQGASVRGWLPEAHTRCSSSLPLPWDICLPLIKGKICFVTGELPNSLPG